MLPAASMACRPTTRLDLLPAELRDSLKKQYLPGALALVVSHLPSFREPDEEILYTKQTLCSWAAACWHLSLLVWAREWCCPWNESTCASAAEGGHLDVLRWARENGCPWAGDTSDRAAAGGHLA